MKRAAIVLMALMGTVFATVVGLAVYWDHRLGPLMDDPDIKLHPTPFHPVEVVDTREIRLGYARCLVPDFVFGELTHLDDTGYVSIDAEGSRSILFCPPWDKDDSSITKVLTGTSVLLERPVKTMFELRRLAMEQQPFSISEIPSIGLREAKARMILLLVKYGEVRQGSSVRVRQDDRVGIILIRRNEHSQLVVADLETGVSQDIIVHHTVGDVERIVSALAQSLKFETDEFDLGSIKKAIAGAGIPERSSQSP